MRILTLMVCFLVASAGSVALAQNQNVPRAQSVVSQTPEAAEEVIVTGKQLGQLRAEIQQAREHAWGIFNSINDFDVVCSDEPVTFSHAKERVCQPRFEGRITSTAAKEYMAALFMTCPAGKDGFIDFQACMTGPYAQRGLARAQGISGEAPPKRDQFSDLVYKIASDNDQFAQAILDVYAAQQKYDAARKPAQRPKGEGD